MHTVKKNVCRTEGRCLLEAGDVDLPTKETDKLNYVRGDGEGLLGFCES